MALKTIVKVSEVSNLSDARYCAGMGVEMIGFPLDENHPKFIDLSRAKEISGWISGVKVVGEFTGVNYDNINYLAEQLNLDFIQLNHPVDIQGADHLKRPLIIKINPDLLQEDLAALLEKYKPHCTYFLLESSENVINIPIPVLKNLCSKFPLIIGSINHEILDEILNTNPAGIGLTGGEEIKAGLKNFDELSEILEKLEEN